MYITLNQGGHLEYNPYAASFAEFKKSVSSAESERDDLLRQLDWYDRFDGSKASSLLYDYRRTLNSLEKQLNDDYERLTALEARREKLKKETNVFLNPLDLFSSARKSKKVELESVEQEFAQLRKKRNTPLHAINETKCLADKLQIDLDRYRSYDPLEAKATINALNFKIELLNSQIEETRPLKDRVDRQLMRPLAELNKLTLRKSEIEIEIAMAEDFERKLSAAPNGYERKKIHESCEARFGESKPAKFISKKRVEMESVKRNIQKLHKRIVVEIKRATRTIKMIVIDGNNLCYQQQNFIGLAALQVVAKRLAVEFSVVIVFDASIRSLLKLFDRDISARFGDGVKVHVVSSRRQADETVLDVAAENGNYVISNDRFGDYADKAAVSEERIIRHEILTGQILIHDLDVAEKFEAVV